MRREKKERMRKKRKRKKEGKKWKRKEKREKGRGRKGERKIRGGETEEGEKNTDELAQSRFDLSTIPEVASGQAKKVSAIVSYDSVCSKSCLYSHYKVICLISVAHKVQLIWRVSEQWV